MVGGADRTGSGMSPDTSVSPAGGTGEQLAGVDGVLGEVDDRPGCGEAALTRAA